MFGYLFLAGAAIALLFWLFGETRRSEIILAVTWGPNQPPDLNSVSVKARWFPWFTVNVVFGKHTIWDGAEIGMNDPSLRHELTHIHDYRMKGRWWMLTHPKEREARAVAAQDAEWPQWLVIGHSNHGITTLYHQS